MFVYALLIVRGRTAASEVTEELKNKCQSLRRYRRQSLILLAPLAVLIAVMMQERRKR